MHWGEVLVLVLGAAGSFLAVLAGVIEKRARTRMANWEHLTHEMAERIGQLHVDIQASDARARAAEQRADEAARTAAASDYRARAAELRADDAAHAAAAAERRLRVTVSHIRELWGWIESGQQPPPPEKPDEVRRELHAFRDLPSLAEDGEDP